MKKLKKLLLISLTIPMLFGIVTVSTPTGVLAASMSCPTCDRTLQEDPGKGICFKTLPNGEICQANQRGWSCNSCHRYWYICGRGHTNL